MSNKSELNLREQSIKKFQDMTGLPEDQTKEIFDMFFDSLSETRKRIIENMEAMDFSGTIQWAHKLRGTAGSLMIDDLYSMSSDLEKAAKKEEIEKIRKISEKLIESIDKYSTEL